MKYFVLIIASIAFIFTACRPKTTHSKPRGFFRIALPEHHSYQTYDTTSFPFTFEYPTYAKINYAIESNRGLTKNLNGFNIEFPDLNATIYLSYKPITEKETFDDLVAQSYKLSYKHDVRADKIEALPIRTQHQLIGVNYNLDGNAASAHQFFLSDSTRHFIRGSLYFNVTPNADSLKPANDFLKKDLDHLIESLQFKP
jgi:gliding motility-associated lipoprotein GldD